MSPVLLSLLPKFVLSHLELCLELNQTLTYPLDSFKTFSDFLSQRLCPFKKIYIASGAEPWKKKTYNCKLKK